MTKTDRHILARMFVLIIQTILITSYPRQDLFKRTMKDLEEFYKVLEKWQKFDFFEVPRGRSA